MPDGLTEGKYVLISFSATQETDWTNAHVGKTIETARDTAPPEVNTDRYYGRFLQGFRTAWPVTDNTKFGIDFISSDAAPASFVENPDEPNQPLSLRALDDWNTLHSAAMKPLIEGDDFHFPHTGVYPGGTPGVMVRGARLGDFKNNIFFPAGGPLVAHHQPLDPGKYSSRVYEIASRSLDKKRYGHLSDVFRVTGTPGNNNLLNPNAPELGSLLDPFAAQSNVCGFEGNDQITLNFTRSEGHGTGWGAVSFAGETPQKAKVVTGHGKAQGFGTPAEEQSTARVVAYMSNESKAGPIAKGFTRCQHWIADDKDGTAHQSAHISTNALFTHGTHKVLFDGPLPFSNRIAPPTQMGEYPFETTIEWDTEQGHTGPCGKKAEGRWKLITRIPMYKFDPFGGTRPNDPFWTMFTDPIKTHGEIGQGFPCENPKKKPGGGKPPQILDPNPRGPADPGATGDPRFDIPNDEGGEPTYGYAIDPNPSGAPDPNATGDIRFDEEPGGFGNLGGLKVDDISKALGGLFNGLFGIGGQTSAENNNIGEIPAVSFTANFAEFQDCSRQAYQYTSPPASPALDPRFDSSKGGSINPYSHIPGYSNGIKMEAPAVFATLCNQSGNGGGAALEEGYDTSTIPGGVPELWSSIYATSRYAIGYLACDRSYVVGWNWRIDGDCLNFQRLDSDGAEIAGDICVNGTVVGGSSGLDCDRVMACAGIVTLQGEVDTLQTDVTALDGRVDDLECPPTTYLEDTDLPVSLTLDDCGSVVVVDVDVQTALGGPISLPDITFVPLGGCCCVTIKNVDNSATEGKGSFVDVTGVTPKGSKFEQTIDGKVGGVSIGPNQSVKFCYYSDLDVTGSIQWIRQ